MTYFAYVVRMIYASSKEVLHRSASSASDSAKELRRASGRSRMANRMLQMVGHGNTKASGVDDAHVETTTAEEKQGESIPHENPMRSTDVGTADNVAKGVGDRDQLGSAKEHAVGAGHGRSFEGDESPAPQKADESVVSVV